MSKTFAVLVGNVVVNAIVAETKKDAEIATNATCIEFTTEKPAGIGYTYNASADEFLAPNEQLIIQPTLAE